MIILYDTSTLDVMSVILGSDATTYSNWNANKPAGSAVVILSDDINVSLEPLNYYMDQHPSPTVTVLKYWIDITASSNPIYLNESPTITIQLKGTDKISDLYQIVTITLTASTGLLANDVLTTDTNGLATTTFNPVKVKYASISGVANKFLSSTLLMIVKNPTTEGEQNWIQTDDLKNEAVTGQKVAYNSITSDKLASSSKPTIVPFSWSLINKARMTDKYDIGFGAGAFTTGAQYIISGEDSIFVIGVNIGTGFNEVKKVSKKDGTVSGTYAFGYLFAGFYGMQYDGKYLYVGTQQVVTIRLHKIKASDMSSVDTYTIVGSPSSLMWDGQYLYSHAGGGMLRITTTGSYKSLGGGGLPNSSPFHVAMTKDVIYNADNDSNVGAYVKKTNNSYYGGNLISDMRAGLAAATGPMATDGVKLWIGCTSNNPADEGIIEVPVWNPDFEPTPTATASLDYKNKQLGGALYGKLIYDGSNLWAITAPAGGWRFGNVMLRKIRRDINDPTKLNVVQTIETGWDPPNNSDPQFSDFCADGQYLWFANASELGV